MPRLEGGLYGLKADPSARADDQNCRHGVMLPVGSAWLSVMCDAGSRTARWVDGLKRAFRAVVVSNSRFRRRAFAVLSWSLTRFTVNAASRSAAAGVDT